MYYIVGSFKYFVFVFVFFRGYTFFLEAVIVSVFVFYSLSSVNYSWYLPTFDNPTSVLFSSVRHENQEMLLHGFCYWLPIIPGDTINSWNPHTQWPPHNYLQCLHFHIHPKPWSKTQLQTLSHVINVLAHFQLRPLWRFTWKKFIHQATSLTSQGWRFSIWSLTAGASYFSKWRVFNNV